MLTLLSISIFTLASNVRTVEASSTIYIRADGAVDPPTAPIASIDNVTYTFTADINEHIVVERDNIVIDGAGYVIDNTENHITDGISLSGRNNITIKNVKINAWSNGIYLYNSFKITICGNNINKFDAITLSLSNNNTIFGNNITNVYHGIWLSGSNNNISDNNITKSEYAVTISGFSNGNTVSGNHVEGNFAGIGLIDSSNNNIILGNNVTNNQLGISFSFSANNNTISENNVSTNDQYGIAIEISSKDNKVLRNNITANKICDISISESSNSYIFGNNITGSHYSIQIIKCSNSSVSENNIENNQYGILLYSSSNNVISGNNITASDYSGIELYWSSSNSIYHNSFVNNADQIHSENSVNSWDNSYPSAGNYWSDYTGVDEKISPVQNQLGSDGIGDTPYVMDTYNVDRYPLTNPWALPRTQIGLSGVLGDNNWFTSNVLAALSAFSGGTGVEKIEYSFDNATWTTYTSSFTITNEGNTTIYFKSTDKNGYVEPIRTKKIKIDKTIPSGSVSINKNDVYTNSTSIELTLDASDAASGIAQMSFSYDNFSWMSWEPYSTSRAKALTTDNGIKTIYVKFKDKAGLISQPFLDTIILDTTAPTILIASPSPTYEKRSSTVTITWAGSDETSGIRQYAIRLDDGSWNNVGTNTTYTFTRLGDGGHTLGIKATDNAGNTKQDTVNFTVNTSPLLGPAYTEEAILTAIIILAALGAAALYFRKKWKRT
jgi:parallel beta-helix repeat protein